MLATNTRRLQRSAIFWGEIAPCEHIVQIYEEDSAFLDSLEGFVRGGFKAGDAVVIIATAAHLSALEQRLRAADIDLIEARVNGQYFPFDAQDSLSKFMVDGWPDEARFTAFVDSILAMARGRNDRRVRAFGEMVAILWASGHSGATVRLEHLWQRFCQSAAFSLFCAYPKAGFTKDADQSIQEICAAHSKIFEV